MDVLNKIAIKLFNDKVGSDEFGNEYYENKNKKKKFVVYKGLPEATKIPSEWRVWIHSKTDKAPSNFKVKKFFWQKMHLPNLTGTSLAYKPNIKVKSKKTYQAWSPDQSI